jgi:sugar lactone lactonase YvrE
MNIPGGAETGSLYRLDGEGKRIAVAQGAQVSNGLAFSPDNRIMYWSDSRSGVVWRFDFDPATGTPSPTDPNRFPSLTRRAASSEYWAARWE